MNAAKATFSAVCPKMNVTTASASLCECASRKTFLTWKSPVEQEHTAHVPDASHFKVVPKAHIDNPWCVAPMAEEPTSLPEPPITVQKMSPSFGQVDKPVPLKDRTGHVDATVRRDK